MAEVTIKVPEGIKDAIVDIDEYLYIEALKEVVRKRIIYHQKRLDEIKDMIAVYEKKYGKPYEVFSKSVPDTLEGHDAWVEWAYLIEVAKELVTKIKKLGLFVE